MNKRGITKIQTVFLICVLIVAAIVGTYLVTTTLTKPAEKSTVTLTLITAYAGGAEKDGLDAVNELFMKENPGIIIRHQPLDVQSFNTIMPVWIAESPPDIFQWWGGAKTQYIVNSGYVLNLSDISDSLHAEFLDQIYEHFMQVNGTPYAVPLFLHSAGLFYSKAIFAQYGITVPETWTDLLHVCDTIRTKSNGTVYPFVVGAMFPWLPDLQLANILGKTLGEEDFHKLVNGEKNWTDGDVITALTHYGELVQYMPPYKFELGEDECAAQFAQGKVAMEIAGPWRGGMVIAAGMNDTEIGWTPVPSINPEFANTMGSGCDILVGSNQTTHPSEVKLYLKFWATTEAQNAFRISSNDISASKNIHPIDYEHPFQRDILTATLGATAFVTEFGFATENDDVKNKFQNILSTFVGDPSDPAATCAEINKLAW